MASKKIYTDRQDEFIIEAILKKGLKSGQLHKWAILRLALARSLRIATPPDEALGRRESAVDGKEYSLEQLSGEGKEGAEDLTPIIRAMLSVRHDEDLFADHDAFIQWLQRHVRRGLREFRTAWMESHDFHDYLLHELFGDTLAVPSYATQQQDDSDRIVKALQEIGIQAEIVERFDGPRLTRYHARLRDANDHGPLTRGLEKLAFVLGLGEAGVFVSTTREPKIAALDIPREKNQWRKVPPSTLATWLEKRPEDWHLPVFLGQDVTGESVGFDLAATPHLLIGGTTGSGKSVCLHSLLLSLIQSFDATQLQLLLIDPKHVELAPYAQLPQTMGGAVLSDVGEITSALNRLVELMSERELQLANLHARDISDAKVAHLGWQRIVVVVEELADLLMQSGSVEDPLIRLAQKARATGIHLVLATQRPDAKTFSGLLRSNIPSRIALTVQKSAESRIILDEVGAEKLLGRGDMLLKLIGQPAIRAHGVMIGPDDIAQGIAYALKR